MKSDKVLWEIVMTIYRDMYSETKPKADLDLLIKKGITKKENWFMDYYLPLNRQKEIFNYWVGKFECTKREKDKIGTEVWLGASPRGGRKNGNKTRR